MTPERPPSRSERLLRSTLERHPPQPFVSPSSSSRPHRRRHSHIVDTTSRSAKSDDVDDDDDDDDQFFRAAFLYRTAATASSPIHPQYPSFQRHSQRTSNSSSPTRDYYSHDSRSRSRAASPSSHPRQYPRPSSPSPRRQSIQRSPASADGNYMSANLQRHNSTPARRRSIAPSIESQPLPLTPHEQVLRARLERVLISGRVVDEREQSREHVPHGTRRRSRDNSVSSGGPWSDHSVLASTTPPKSTSSSDHGHLTQSHQMHYRSRSKTDPHTSPSLVPTTFASRRATTTTSPYFTLKSSPPSSAPGPTRRNHSNSSSWTPPLTADTSPVLSEPLDHSLPGEEADGDVDSRLLLTPPPTPPLYDTFSATATPPALTTAVAVGNASATATPGSISTYRSPSRTRDESSDCCSTSSPYLYQGREVDGSVEQLDLSLSAHPHHHPHRPRTFNARKASERCRMMEGYVSFAQVEGLGMPPDGVDDDDETKDRKSREGEEGKRGKVLSVNIGTWARKLFVGVQTATATAQS